ncbi:MAG: hypothetical protein OEM45_06010 [Gammaproteobacteria bacterium]|nr:hypothetical protein [Gammaproteobacteria bacterium]
MAFGKHGRAKHVELVAFESTNLGLIEMQLFGDLMYRDLLRTARLGQSLSTERGD